MKQFKDNQGCEWVIDVNIGAIKAVRELVKVDLYALFADEAKRLFADPVLLVDTVYVLCREQADQRKLTDIDFGKLFEGDVLEAAANALLEAVVDFFPSSRRTILRATVNKSEQIAAKLQAKALETIDRLDVTDLLKATGSPAPSA